MATRLQYALPIARQLLRTTVRRLLPGGLGAGLPPPGDQPFVIVTGTGRSGTSAVTRVLHESGLRMGTEFDPPSEYNPAGFFEDCDARAINILILGEAGLSDVRTIRSWPGRASIVAVAEKYAREMEEIASRGVSGWKDPRFAITLEAWLPHLPRRPKIVVCLRSPEAFLQSVVQIRGLVDRKSVERWWVEELRHVLDVVRDYRLEATCIEYDDLLAHPEEVVSELSSFVGVPLDAKYIQPEFRHFSYTVPRRHAALYARVLSLASPRAQEAAKRREGTDTAGYAEAMRSLETRVDDANAAWSERLGEPEPRLLQQGTNGDALAEAGAACEPYLTVLRGAQAELGTVAPPAQFERYHDLLREYVDYQRFIAQLIFNTANGKPPPNTSLSDVARAWHTFSGPDVLARGRRERERALRAAR